jgi:hypothetical protein
MRRLRAVFILLATQVLLSACSGGDGPTDPDDGNNGGNNGTTGMSATIDGQAWSAGANFVTAAALNQVSGSYIIMGVPTGSANSVTMLINFVTKTGTYPLGVDGASVPGGFASVSGGGIWTTPFSGAAGSITISTITSSRIAGNFQFTAVGTSGATGTRVVTNGVFDVPVSPATPIPVLTDSMGSTMSGTLNGQAWNGAIVSGQTTPTHFSILAINDRQSLNFTMPKPTAAGTYIITEGPGSILRATDPGVVPPAGARCCYGIAGDRVTIVLTSLTTTRARGSFAGSLRAVPGTAASGSLSLNGSFDIGLFHTP